MEALETAGQAHREPWERAEAFRSFVDHNDDLMLVVDPASNLVYVNQACERVFGIGRQECLGRALLDFVHPEDLTRTREALQRWRSERGTSSFTFENRQLNWNGTVLQLLWTVTPCWAEDDSLRCLALCGRDIGPLWRIERDRAQREARHRALLAGMLDPVVTIDGHGFIHNVSDSVQMVFGYAPAELVGKNVSVLMPAPHRGDHDDYLAHYRRTGETNILNRTREFDVLHKDGTLLRCELAVSRVDVPGDGEPLFIGCLHDVTARKRAEALLKESEQRFRAIFEQEFQLVGLLRLDGTVIEVNRAALETTGLSRAEVVGRPFWEVNWRVNAPGDTALLRRAILAAAAGEFVRFETEIRAPSGETIAVDFSLKPIRDEQGRIALLLPEGRDITRLRNAQRRETAMLRALAEIGESASLIAHEIKNPITAIHMTLRAVADQLGEEHKEILTDLAQRLQRLERTMRRTLSFARPLELNCRPVAPRTLLESAAATVRPEFERSGIAIEIACEGELPEVDVDAALLEEALGNLLKNALEALPNGGRVRLSGARGGARSVVLVVEDDGPGVSSTLAPSLFKPFLTDKAGGTGLGLALCRKIVEEHRGRITAGRSNIGGARFEMRLPALPASHAEAGILRPSARVTTDEGVSAPPNDPFLQGGGIRA